MKPTCDFWDDHWEDYDGHDEILVKTKSIRTLAITVEPSYPG